VNGIHNGIILNDDELLAPHTCARSEPRMTVDSEAIFCLAAHSRNNPRALEELHGSLAAAWLDARLPGTVFAARGAGRPLWIGSGRHEIFFASTRVALEVVERYLRLRLRKREIAEGTFLELAGARVVRSERFRSDKDYRDPIALPAVRAPQEGRSCLAALAALAAA
jgi:glutamine phosphoribosylpyrophosphate amidotransferase